VLVLVDVEQSVEEADGGGMDEEYRYEKHGMALIGTLCFLTLPFPRSYGRLAVTTRVSLCR